MSSILTTVIIVADCSCNRFVNEKALQYFLNRLQMCNFLEFFIDNQLVASAVYFTMLPVSAQYCSGFAIFCNYVKAS